MRLHSLSAGKLAAALAAAVLCTPVWSQQRLAPDKPPIKVGAISTLSGGPAGFAPTALAAQAFFESVNVSGGIQGRKLVLIQEDDKTNPQAAREAARRLIHDHKVVANVGGASLLECSVNAQAYKDAGMVSIPGLGLDGGCFRSPMIAPVNAGPYAQLRLAMTFATERLWAERLCVLRVGSPDNPQTKGFDAAIKTWEARSGRKLHLDEPHIGFEDDMTAHIKKAVDARCQAIVFGGPSPFVIATAKAARKVGTGSIALLYLGAAYTTPVVEALGADGEGIYAMSEFEPWSSRSGSLSNWRSLMSAAKVPETSSSQGGYVAAQVFVHTLRGIRGEITRESVTAAFKAMNRYDLPMLGMPFTFGSADAHHPNRAAIPVRLEQGRWRIAHHDWIRER
jgi:branched-chain amino acid transport system substrate-binding protein